MNATLIEEVVTLAKQRKTPDEIAEALFLREHIVRTMLINARKRELAQPQWAVLERDSEQ